MKSTVFDIELADGWEIGVGRILKIMKIKKEFAND